MLCCVKDEESHLSFQGTGGFYLWIIFAAEDILYIRKRVAGKLTSKYMQNWNFLPLVKFAQWRYNGNDFWRDVYRFLGWCAVRRLA